MFELLKVAQRTALGIRSEKLHFGFFFQAQIRTSSISTGYTVEVDRLHALFCILTLYYSVTIKFKKFVRTCLLVGQTENFK